MCSTHRDYTAPSQDGNLNSPSSPAVQPMPSRVTQFNKPWESFVSGNPGATALEGPAF